MTAQPIRTVGVGGFEVTPEARAAVMAVLDSGRLSYGPVTKEFEGTFARDHNLRFAAFCNSGTSALHVAMQALKILGEWQDGDQVIVPAVTFVATSNIVLHNNLTPVFVDIEWGRYGLNPALLEAAITPRTRAIIPVHLFGQACDMGPIMEIARRHDLRVLEDSCEAMYAKYEGKSVGSFGDASAFSTYAAHVLVTGVGGLACSNRPEVAQLMRSLLNHGRDGIYIAIDDDEVEGEALKEVMSRRFVFEHVGHSFRATEMEAALGVVQLKDAASLVAKRRAIAARLTAGLAPYGERLILPKMHAGSDHSFMMYPIVTGPGVDRDDLTFYLEEHGVETRHMMPLTNQPIYERMWPGLEARFPVAREINRRGFYIGSHPAMSLDDADYVAEVFGDYFSQQK
ncbi:MAG: DegT/DnrJ/EryC1/StrS family aminotransferase [Dehalococcoidia bacterium]|nr:MAG: DegT/DnrJ/EryC1/StrS family aminotransferase [Dehalococcoidia bacterium]